EDVELAVLAGDGDDRLGHCCRIGDIEGGDFRLELLPGERIDLDLERGAIAAVQQHERAVLRQRLGDGEADAARSAGDQRDAALEREHVAHRPLSTSSTFTQRPRALDRVTASITRCTSQASRKSGHALPLPATASSRSRTSMTFMSLKPS